MSRSIQIRKISEKVSRYFRRFGYRPYTRYTSNGARILAAKELGFDQVECSITETSRGTAVAFNNINTWTSMITGIPLLLATVLVVLNRYLESFSEWLSAGFLGFHIYKLLLGTVEFKPIPVTVFLGIAIVFSLTNYAIRQVRLESLKSKFAFLTKDAVWSANDIPRELISLKAAQYSFYVGWVFALIYYAVLSMPSEVLEGVATVYSTSAESLQIALNQGFAVVGSSIIALTAGDKAQKMRKELSSTDKGLKYSGGRIQRTYEPYLYSLSTALVSTLIFFPFLFVTFMQELVFTDVVFIFFGSVVGSIISGYIKDEGAVAYILGYASVLLFTSIFFVFQTGQFSAIAFVVIHNLLLLPFSLILLANVPAIYVLERRKIKTTELYYQIFPYAMFITFYLHRKRQREAERMYELELEDDENLEQSSKELRIDLSKFRQFNDKGLLVVKHYFELLLWYNSRTEDELILLPSFDEMLQYWQERTERTPTEEQQRFLAFADQFVWDHGYVPKLRELDRMESIGKNMVIATL